MERVAFSLDIVLVECTLYVLHQEVDGFLAGSIDNWREYVCFEFVDVVEEDSAFDL